MPPSRLPGYPGTKRKYCLCCGITIGASDQPNLNKGWANATWERKQEIIADHTYFELGTFFYMANDPKVPAAVRATFSSYGLCAATSTSPSGHASYARRADRICARPPLISACNLMVCSSQRLFFSFFFLLSGADEFQEFGHMPPQLCEDIPRSPCPPAPHIPTVQSEHPGPQDMRDCHGLAHVCLSRRYLHHHCRRPNQQPAGGRLRDDPEQHCPSAEQGRQHRGR